MLKKNCLLNTINNIILIVIARILYLSSVYSFPSLVFSSHFSKTSSGLSSDSLPLVANQINSTNPIVSTKWGLIEGTVEKIGQYRVQSFKGIPFSQPPLGHLRFKRSLPLKGKYKGIYNAKHFRNGCMQISSAHVSPISEDCLHLNIWIPYDNISSSSSSFQFSSNLKPVFVFIHGSAFTLSSATKFKYDGGYLAAEGNIVVVTINYRLGPFGFLYSGNDDAPGNQAFYDQMNAFQWINDNIQYFSGDPNRITLGGQSAGAASITYHLINNPEHKIVFHRAIIMSGHTWPELVSENTDLCLEKAQTLARLSNCIDKSINNHNNTNNTNTNKNDNNNNNFNNYNYRKENYNYRNYLTIKQIECLRSVKAENLVKYSDDWSIRTLGWNFGTVSFSPTFGDKFAPISLVQAMSKGYIRPNIPVLIGHTLHEWMGSVFTSFTFTASSKAKFIDDIKKNTPQLLPKAILRNIDKFISEYMIDSDISENTTDDNFHYNREILARLFNNFMTDSVFRCPLKKLAARYAQFNKNQTYFYRLTFAPNSSSEYERPMHTDDTLFLFALPFRFPLEYTDGDRETSKLMIKIWSDFIYGKQLGWESIKSNNNNNNNNNNNIIFNEYEINPIVKKLNNQSKLLDKCDLWNKVLSIDW